jgi:hypothetical protein
MTQAVLARYAPGLAPTPIRADLGTDPSRTVRVLAIDQTADTLRQRGGRVASRPQRWSSGPVSTGTFLVSGPEQELPSADKQMPASP